MNGSEECGYFNIKPNSAACLKSNVTSYKDNAVLLCCFHNMIEFYRMNLLSVDQCSSLRELGVVQAQHTQEISSS